LVLGHGGPFKSLEKGAVEVPRMRFQSNRR
jgi:hypothetical protein